MSSIDPELLPLLACPASHQSLKQAEPELLARLAAAMATSQLCNVGGQAVTEPVTEGLVREDGRIVYPVREGIPVLLVDEGIEVPRT
ncbi:MAG: hypothetical protein H6830_10055 [Planctomycetes bacterium]|nr:hypothetical protein [Planctomycetota bacterium]MCB9909456.1 hypothetical protein [Planctomycetota bacterium]